MLNVVGSTASIQASNFRSKVCVFDDFPALLSKNSENRFPVCSLLGFGQEAALNFLSNTVVTESEEQDTSKTVFVRLDRPSQVYEMGVADINVGFVDGNALKQFEICVLPTIQALVDGVFTLQKPTKLVLLIEGNKNTIQLQNN